MKTAKTVKTSAPVDVTPAYRAGSVGARMLAHGRLSHGMVTTSTRAMVCAHVDTYGDVDTFTVSVETVGDTTSSDGTAYVAALSQDVRLDTCAHGGKVGDVCTDVMQSPVRVFTFADYESPVWRDGHADYTTDEKSGESTCTRMRKGTGTDRVYTHGSRYYVKEGKIARTYDIVARLSDVAADFMSAYVGVIDEPRAVRVTDPTARAQARAHIVALETKISQYAGAIASGKLTPENLRKAHAMLQSANEELARARGVATSVVGDDDPNKLFG